MNVMTAKKKKRKKKINHKKKEMIKIDKNKIKIIVRK